MFKLRLLVVAALSLGPQAAKGRIVGGVDANPDMIRYHALLKKGGTYFCSGALISDTHVLTSSHCVLKYELADGLTAVFGTISLTSGGQSYDIVGRQTHPFIDWRHFHKIGIFKLKSAVMLSGSVVIGTLAQDRSHYTEAIISAAGSATLQGEYRPHLQMLSVRLLRNIFISNVDRGQQIYSEDIGAPVANCNVIIGVAIEWDNENSPLFRIKYATVLHSLSWIEDVIRNW